MPKLYIQDFVSSSHGMKFSGTNTVTIEKNGDFVTLFCPKNIGRVNIYYVKKWQGKEDDHVSTEDIYLNPGDERTFVLEERTSENLRNVDMFFTLKNYITTEKVVDTDPDTGETVVGYQEVDNRPGGSVSDTSSDKDADVTEDSKVGFWVFVILMVILMAVGGFYLYKKRLPLQKTGDSNAPAPA